MPHNFSHDNRRSSWIESGNAPDTAFPLQNLPLGVFSTPDHDPRIGVAIGDQILDLKAAAAASLFPAELAHLVSQCRLNALLAAGPAIWTQLRTKVSELLGADSCPPGPTRTSAQSCLQPQATATLHLPAAVGDYTDFYSSIHHATNVGRLFRPDSPLLPNYRWVPIGYHGRCSSLVISGTNIRRPSGQQKPVEPAPPSFAPSAGLDFELEIGAFVGPGNPLGTPVPIGSAARQLFGVVLLNDWSARDVQSWEYQPLGPFLGKNFATSISPWVVTMEALAPFRCPASSRAPDDPTPLPYLEDAEDQAAGGLDIILEAYLLTERMRAEGAAPHRLTRGNFQSTYWTLAQLVAHHTSNGCNLQPGDLLGSGTISGPTPGSAGCLLESTQGGREPLLLPNGEIRRYLADGDEVILRGWCERPGFRRIGLGECRGRILPAT